MTATAVDGRLPREPRSPSGFRARPNEWWGMLMLIATELTLFALLLFSYFFVRFKSAPPWPPDGIKDPKLLKPAVMTVILLASSGPIWWAERGIRLGRSYRLLAGFAGGFLLGAAFLTLQVFEYLEKVKESTPRTDAYSSLFYTITTLHGAHVLVGLLLIAWTWLRALRGRYTRARHVAVQTTALYWHFVDGVWIFIFGSLYLSPHA
jgi:heme/copper-type cytochrome/quinol oxidase subunit 3